MFMASEKNIKITCPGFGLVEFPDAEATFRKLYEENGIDSGDDSAVVNFLKSYTRHTNTSGDNLREERQALEIIFLAEKD